MNTVITAITAFTSKIPHIVESIGTAIPPEISGPKNRAETVARYLLAAVLGIVGTVYLALGAMQGKARGRHWATFISCLLAGSYITPQGHAAAQNIIDWFATGQ